MVAVGTDDSLRRVAGLEAQHTDAVQHDEPKCKKEGKVEKDSIEKYRRPKRFAWA